MALIQIILAIALVVIFFIIGFAIYNMEFINSIRQKGVVKVETPIFVGVKDLYGVQDEMYNTVDPKSGSYRAIVSSYNQSAGIEYTYNFWLYVDREKIFTNSCTNSTERAGDVGFKETTMNTTASAGDNGAPIILFLKGNKELVQYKNVCGVNKVDVMVKSPLVKLEQCGNYLTVEFNTVQSHEAISENSPNICSATNPNWNMANVHKLALPGLKDKTEFDKKWCMFTIVIQDTYPTDPYPLRNQVRCRIYVNGLLELDRYVDGKLNPLSDNDRSASVLKTNNGNFHVAPKLTRTISGTNYSTYKPNVEKALMMANLTYYNYALTGGEVDALFNKKFSKTTAAVPGAGSLDTDLYSIVTKPTKKQFNV